MASDGFLTQEYIINIFNFPNAHFAAYQYHLFQSLRKNGGSYDGISSYIRSMIYVRTAKLMYEMYNYASAKLYNSATNNQKLVNEFQDFYE